MPNKPPSVLVVEDNALIAMDVEELVEGCGCAVRGPVGTVDEALEIIRDVPLDGAVLDVHLGDDRVWPVAEQLADQGVPFLLATGYQVVDLPERFRDVPLLAKPLSRQSVERGLKQIGVVGSRLTRQHE